MIETHALSRSFKKVKAVDGLDLKVQAGELFGLVGPDGAGKTTTLRLLAGLLDISSGSATISNFDLATQAEKIKPLVGYMAQRFSLYAELSVVENLSFFAELYGVLRPEIDSRTERLLEFAGLAEFRHRRAAHLSGGMQKKLALACTLIHQPPLLLLDEPTTGVDPVSRREFWDILTDLHLEGTSIVISTPYMDEADRCSMVGLMYQGRLVECAPPREIRRQVEGELLELHTGDWQAACDALSGLPGVLEVQTYGRKLHLLVDSRRKRMRQIERALRAASVRVEDLQPGQARMEEAFISLIRRMREEQGAP